MDISTENRDLSQKWLNHILADTYVIYTKAYKFHWQVKGLTFMQLHLHFEKIFQELIENVDSLAERIRALDFLPFGTLRYSEFPAYSQIFS